ncbi:hypothetical protein G7Y89_g14395 [Cudoniella acicularis]|uniref:Uncharacterized protein n=1 Tax=Cudoniella acicularis TaxID=354080 RepID=A0A8H4R4B2_9HELO|nr:hypothetical protein G7Y89_g14395 [Cudoniella acicularis]
MPKEVLQKLKIDEKDLKGLEDFPRASNYIAAAMIFLSDNALIERNLKFDDIKPRRLEGSLERFYPQYSQTKQGLHNLITGFSTLKGFPSHINAETPGSIHEGSELRHALAVAFGAVMDKPDLIVGCIVGDGEAESGPTATAWHTAKYIDPVESGAVIPIVYVNGFKISERTIYGCMDDKEIVTLFTGYGYQCRFVEDLEDIMASSSKVPSTPVKSLMAAKTNKDQLAGLQKWLLSYGPKDLFTKDGVPTDSIKSVIPSEDYKKLTSKSIFHWRDTEFETYCCAKHIPLYNQPLPSLQELHDGLSPDVGIGSELMFEVVVAASILRRKCPLLRVRVVNVTDLMILEAETLHPHSLTDDKFSSLFTPDKPIHINYHGYSNEIKGLLFGRLNLSRVSIACYKEEGSTTTPLDMMLRNGVSRYHVMEAAIKGVARSNERVALEITGLLGEVRHQVSKVQESILERGRDPEGTFDIPRFEGMVFVEGKKRRMGRLSLKTLAAEFSENKVTVPINCFKAN